VRQSWFIDFVAVGIQGGVKLLLGIPGPAGHQGASVLLNGPQMTRAAAGPRAGVRQLLVKELARLRAYPFPPRPRVNHGNDVGLP
jgi:hypothetical protein